LGGTRWAAYAWTFISPDDRRVRDELLMHELFHRIQPAADRIVMHGIEGAAWECINFTGVDVNAGSVAHPTIL
jgi:hypothetical protein